MGWKLKRIEVKLEKNEEKDLCVLLTPENRAAIHGVVRFPNGKPVKDAVVKLFKRKSSNPCDLIPVTFAFTDKCGQFLFGVDSCTDYVIKVFFYEPEDCKRKKECDEYDMDC